MDKKTYRELKKLDKESGEKINEVLEMLNAEAGTNLFAVRGDFLM